MIPDQRYAQRLLVHVKRPGAVALAPYAMLPGAPALVGGEDDESVVAQAEFVETLRAIEHNHWLAGSLGKKGRQYYRDHYDWPVIERKYLDMFERLKNEVPGPGGDPLPGWFDRRRQDLPAAQDVLAKLPKGPAGRHG